MVEQWLTPPASPARNSAPITRRQSAGPERGQVVQAIRKHPAT